MAASIGAWTCLTDTSSTASTWNLDYSYDYVSDTSAWITHVRKYEEKRSYIPASKKTYGLPDGAKLIVDADGNYRIEDSDAKVTYQANRIREFSPHLNASDMVAGFVDYVRQLGVKRDDVMGLPLELFIAWLVIEAAERDGDPVPDDIDVVGNPSLIEVIRPRCLSCGRFIPRAHARNRFPFCSSMHVERYLAKQHSLAVSG